MWSLERCTVQVGQAFDHIEFLALQRAPRLKVKYFRYLTVTYTLVRYLPRLAKPKIKFNEDRTEGRINE